MKAKASRYLVEGVLHLVEVRPLVEVAGQQLGQQRLGHVCHAAQDEADQDLESGGPSQLHILLTLPPIGKGHQEQQQSQARPQTAGHRFLQGSSTSSAVLHSSSIRSASKGTSM